ncbi:NPCBM/NEW2 domain-containing protein [Pendulispora rubella]|uniref:Alpha-galactosidase n=1 Tax=Pendulispora rubella TaxID=2741070 RepID=A0ABZ2KQW2_9BACT
MSVRTQLVVIATALPCVLGVVDVAVSSDAAAAPRAENGLARTPQMGFNNWNATHCRADFNEAMVKGIADLFVSEGLKDAGYQYVNLDDCWALPNRDATGNLVPDPVRFPNGIKAVADYVHGKGLKFGIYSSAGSKTCDRNGFPGGLGHEQQDANLWASWGVDYLKYDNCNNQGVDAVQRYTTMGNALKATGRPILYSLCEWGENKPWTWAKDIGNSWRTTGDITDRYSSMLSLFKKNVVLDAYAGPGHWNDPDMLEVGNGGMTDTEYRSHFALWAIMAAPLLVGSDLRTATPATLEILTNKDIIEVDQDALGVQGKEIRQAGGFHVIVKPLSNGDRAVALFNETDAPATISTSAAEIGLAHEVAYKIRDLWSHSTKETAGAITASVAAHGTAIFRIGRDPHWAQYPPAVDLGIAAPATSPGLPLLVAPGSRATVTTTATNDGFVPAVLPQVTLSAPAGWRVQAQSSSRDRVISSNEALATTWSVAVPSNAAPGNYPLDATVSYFPGQGRATVVKSHIDVTVPELLPRGTSYLGDDPWLRADNGWGPVERNTSVGEDHAGDGHPLVVNGVTYAKGLGVHAQSSVVYYVGGTCSKVRALVGLDDEKTGAGSVAFEIWADGTKVADSGLIVRGTPTKTLEADVSRATVLRLVVTDGGDGITNDHADWADAQVVCP